MLGKLGGGGGHTKTTTTMGTGCIKWQILLKCYQMFGSIKCCLSKTLLKYYQCLDQLIGWVSKIPILEEKQPYMAYFPWNKFLLGFFLNVLISSHPDSISVREARHRLNRISSQFTFIYRRLIVQSTAQSHLRVFHKFKSRTS